jgi:hypothetical protein
MRSLPEGASDTKQRVFVAVFTVLRGLLTSQEEAPVIVAGSLDALASTVWDGIGEGILGDGKLNVVNFVLALSGETTAGRRGAALPWTVREVLTNCFAVIAARCRGAELRQHSIISLMVESAERGLMERKFWQVR